MPQLSESWRTTWFGSCTRGVISRQQRNAHDWPAAFLSTQGGTDHWEINWQVETNASASEVLTLINKTLAADEKWTQVDSGKSNNGTKSLWKFADEQGNPWSGVATVQPLAGERNKLIATVKIARGDGGL
jgi:hypothetical protein